MPAHDHPPAPPVSPVQPPRLAPGIVPEAPARPRGLLVFVLIVMVAALVTILRTLSGGTPFVLVAGIYFPAWFSAGFVGAALAGVTVLALRSWPITRAAGNALVFFNCAVVYAFLAWLLLFS